MRWLLVLLLLSTLSLEAQHPRWLLRNVQVVDVEKGVLLDDPQDLLIADGHIKTMAPAHTLDWNPLLTQIDGTGKYVIPGLWDMHAHPDDPEVWRMNPTDEYRDWLMPQFILYGVTGIRDMAGSLDLAKRWRQLGAKGTLLVPHIVACGPLLDGPNPMWDGSVGINSVDQVPRVADSLMQAGADFLKVYSLLPRDIYLALAEYAGSQKISMVGHVPLTVPPSEAAVTGLNSQEHLLEILQECSSRYEDLISNNLDYGQIEDRFARYLFKQNLMLDTFDEQRWQELLKTFQAYNTWHTPTLSMWAKNAWFEQERIKDDSLFKFLPPYLKKYWTVTHNDHLKYRDNPDFIALKQRLYGFYEKLVLDLSDAGIGLLAGTDTGANPLCWPGLGVHNELAALVKAGLTPAQALKTATINPVLFLGMDDQLGKVATSYQADLVILEGNPLEQINHTRAIWGVVHKGQLLDPDYRSQYFKKIDAAVNSRVD